MSWLHECDRFGSLDGKIYAVDWRWRSFGDWVAACPSCHKPKPGQVPTPPASQESAGEAVAYLYHDAPSVTQIDLRLHSVTFALAADRLPNYRNETALVLASDYATLTAELAEAREQRDRWIREAGENMDIARDVIAERELSDARLHEVAEACATAEQKLAASEARVGRMREVLHTAMEALRHSRPWDAGDAIKAALSASGREGE